MSQMRWISALKFVLLFVLAMIFSVSCATSTVTPLSVDTISSNCRMIRHSFGETCVPQHPQRIVTLANPTLSNLLALGIKPVGTVPYYKAPGQVPIYLEGQVDEIESVGTEEQPNLEAIFKLQPDLIIGLDYVGEASYNQLSQVAPTVMDHWVGHPSWRDHFNFLAELVDHQEAAQQVWQHYYQRIEELKGKLGDRLQNVETSFVHMCCGTVDLDLKNSFNGSILNDVGLKRPPSQDKTVDGGIILLSEERLLDIDGDILFVAAYNSESTQKLDELKQKPLWNRLKAVETGRVYPVDYSVWRGGNVLAADALLDDLFKYLVPTNSG